MTALKGAPEFRRRLKAISATKIFTPLGKAWADEAVTVARDRLSSYSMPYSGTSSEDRKNPGYRLIPSIKRKYARQSKAVVVASYHAYFVDAGTQGAGPSSRATRARTRARSRGTFGFTAYEAKTIFSRKSRKGYAARPFRKYMAAEALRRHPMSDELIKAWNAAA